MSSEKKFQAGDEVSLKSGSASMVVEGYADFDPSRVRVRYWHEGVVVHDEIGEACLRKESERPVLAL